MDRAYMNMLPELRGAIRRHKFGDYDQLTTLATGVERMLKTLKSKESPRDQKNRSSPNLPIYVKTGLGRSL